MVTKSAVIGIDLGASESLVAYVGKGVVDLVQNEVSRRATPSLVGFTDRERLLGDAALALIRSNAKNTCRNFKHLLACDVSGSGIEKEHFWSLSQLAQAEDAAAGYSVSYKGESKVFSAVPVTAMYLTRLKDITEKWCQSKVADAVISVPSYFGDAQRQALLDAAKIAGISVLRVMNEHTATALAYGIYRSNDFDPEKPMTVAFCSIGHTLFSVSIVQFLRGKLKVLAEKSDRVGGRDMDECLIREFASQFKKKHNMDPLSNKKSLFKLEDAVTKTKKILSANAEAPLSVECLMEDYDFGSNITRDDFEKMCQPMMDRVKAVLDGAIALSGVTVDQVDSVEVVGGASRVPWWKTMCSQAFGGKELSTTMNADESVARGCALQAAILSPLYKVRDFKVQDTTLVGVSISWQGTAVDPSAQDGNGEDTLGGDGATKVADIFPAGSMMNMIKMITFFRKGPFDIKAHHLDDGSLVAGVNKQLGSYRIDVPAQAKNEKIKVKLKMTLNGMFTVESAQLVLEEEYEETVKEPKQPEGNDENAGATNADAAAADAKKEPEMVEVVKKKIRQKRTDLHVHATGRPGLSTEMLQKLLDQESCMQAEMKDIIETDEKKNDLESYIFSMRDKIAESGEYGPFASGTERDSLSSDLQKAEDWLYDQADATKAQYIEKLDELKKAMDSVVWRVKESGMRDDWVKAVQGTILNYRQAAENPGERYGHIAVEKRVKITERCSELEKWLTGKKGEQDKLQKYEKPVLLCADMEKRSQDLSKFANDILKEPKPPPPKPPPREQKKPAKTEKTPPKTEEPKKEEASEAAEAASSEPTKPAESAAPAEKPEGPENMDID